MSSFIHVGSGVYLMFDASPGIGVDDLSYMVNTLTSLIGSGVDERLANEAAASMASVMEAMQHRVSRMPHTNKEGDRITVSVRVEDGCFVFEWRIPDDKAVLRPIERFLRNNQIPFKKSGEEAVLYRITDKTGCLKLALLRDDF